MDEEYLEMEQDKIRSDYWREVIEREQEYGD